MTTTHDFTHPNCVLVRFNSHRARRKVIGRHDYPAFWSMEHRAKGGYYEVPAGMLSLVRATRGATVARRPADLQACW